MTPEDKLLDDLMEKAHEAAVEHLEATTDTEAELAEVKTLAEAGFPPEVVAQIEHSIAHPETWIGPGHPDYPVRPPRIIP